MFCNKCGNQVNDGAKFCNKCGNTMNVNAAASANPPVMERKSVQAASAGLAEAVSSVKMKNKRPLIIIAAVVAVVALVSSLVIPQKIKEKNLDAIESTVAAYASDMSKLDFEGAAEYCVPGTESLAGDISEAIGQASGVLGMLGIETEDISGIISAVGESGLFNFTVSMSREDITLKGKEAQMPAEITVSVGGEEEKSEYNIERTKQDDIWYISSLEPLVPAE